MKRLVANIYFILLFASLVIAATPAGKLPPKVKVLFPSALRSEILKESEVKRFLASGNWGQDQGVSQYWKVWSDRDENVTHVSPSETSAVFTKLNFNESVYIAEISGDFAHVFEEPMPTYKYPTISSKAKSKGWIKMDKLLLWSVCLSNEKSITRKGLLGVNLEKKEKGQKQEIGLVYTHPRENIGRRRVSNEPKFYFVMKTDAAAKRKLLAVSTKLSGSTDKLLLGWVDDVCIVPWEQNTCLEPNWDPELVMDFKNKDVKLEVFGDQTMAEENKRGKMPYGNKNSEDNNERTYYRMKKGALRYPILDSHAEDNNIYRITAYSNGEGDMSVAAQAQDEKNSVHERFSGKKSRVNLIFVIDGTSSMEPYFKSVVNAIKEGVSIFTAEGMNRDVRVGAVIYRDYEDGEFVSESRRLTSPTDMTFLHWLEKGGEYGVKSKAKSQEEALYYGINEALNASKMGYTHDESNLMLVVGDCGNHLNDKRVSEEGIKQKLHQYQFQIMSFQVHANDNNTANALFKDQMRKLISGNVEEYIKLMKTKVRDNFEIKYKWAPLKNGGFDLKVSGTEMVEKYFVGAIRSAASGNVGMDANELTSLIKNRFGAYSRAVSAQMKLTVDDAIFNNFEESGLDESQRNGFLIDQAFAMTKYTPEEWKAMQKSNTMQAIEGYTRIKDVAGNDYYKSVLFLSQSEFQKLIKELLPVAESARKDVEDRKAYVDAVREFVKLYNPGMDDAEIMHMSADVITEMVSGLHVKNQALSNYTLNDLRNPAKVDAKEFKKLRSKVVSKYNKLIDIYRKYPYRMTMHDQVYYWLPIEDLP